MRDMLTNNIFISALVVVVDKNGLRLHTKGRCSSAISPLAIFSLFLIRGGNGYIVEFPPEKWL